MCARNEYEFVQPLRGKKDLHIVNVGCAGSHTMPVRTLIKPNVFIQRDMDARANLATSNTSEQKCWYATLTDTSTQAPKLRSGDILFLPNPAKWWVCATGDNANGYSRASEESQPLTLWTWRLTLLQRFVPIMK